MTCSRVQLIQETAGPRTLRDRSRTAEFLVGPPCYAQYHPPCWGRAQKRQTPQGARRKASRWAPQPLMEARLTPHRTPCYLSPLSPLRPSLPGCPSIHLAAHSRVWLSGPICPDSAPPRLTPRHEQSPLWGRGLLPRLPWAFCGISGDTMPMTAISTGAVFSPWTARQLSPVTWVPSPHLASPPSSPSAALPVERHHQAASWPLSRVLISGPRS